MKANDVREAGIIAKIIIATGCSLKLRMDFCTLLGRMQYAIKDISPMMTNSMPSALIADIPNNAGSRYGRSVSVPTKTVVVECEDKFDAARIDVVSWIMS